jgi:hypothetical protein
VLLIDSSGKVWPLKDESSGKGSNAGNDMGTKTGTKKDSTTLHIPNPRCSHCCNATIHKLLELGPMKNVFFFLELPQVVTFTKTTTPKPYVLNRREV